MPKVTIIQGDETKVVEAAQGETILSVAQNADIPMMSACGGMGVCTTCMVEVKDNKENLSPVTESEQVMGFDENSTHRLGCQVEVTGDVTVEMS